MITEAESLCDAIVILRTLSSPAVNEKPVEAEKGYSKPDAPYTGDLRIVDISNNEWLLDIFIKNAPNQAWSADSLKDQGSHYVVRWHM